MEHFSRQFGILIAYLLPGFVALAGLSPLIPAISGWLQPNDLEGGWGIGLPIYALLSATALGMFVSCFRWLLIDHLLEWTGVPKAACSYQGLEEKLTAYDYLIDVHYRYYQCYSNGLTAILWAYGMHRYYRTLPLLGPGTDLGIVILSAVLLTGSRDALSKYRIKLGQLLAPVAEKACEGRDMTNGADHHGGGGSTKKPHTESKEKPATPHGKDKDGKPAK